MFALVARIFTKRGSQHVTAPKLKSENLLPLFENIIETDISSNSA